MKVVAHTGLVPVKALRAGGNYGAGQVFGLLPARAATGVASGEVALVPIPEGIETIDVPIQVPAQVAKVAPEKPPELFGDGPVVIPADWKEIHHLKRVSLARQILRIEKLEPPEGMKPLEYADFVIDREVKARAVAAEGGGGGAGDGDPNPSPNPNESTQTQTQTEEPPAPSAEGGGGGAPPSTA